MAGIISHGRARSHSFSICSGVPQGSHLGPLIFVLFINDLCTVLKSDKLLYADDLKFYRTISSLVDCCALQQDIDSLMRWCHHNGMVLNIAKCNIITFTRLQHPINFEYKASSEILSRTPTVKDLGVVLDSKLKFSQHISETIAKAFAVLGFIRRNTQFFNDFYSLKSLYCSLVRSILEYCIQVWSPHQIVHSNRIERVQRCFLRYALRQLPWNDGVRLPPYEQRCLLLNLPTLASRRIFLQRVFVFDILQNNLDCPDLLSMLPFNAPSRATRSRDFFRPPFRRTQYGQNNPLDRCCALFNEVSSDFDFNISKNIFKARIR